MKRILVTGGAGFIGSHIVDAYIERGWEVLVIDNLSTGKRENVNQRAKFVELDIRSPRLEKVLGEFCPDVVNHHAAQINLRKSVDVPLFDAEVNILGTINLLEGMRKNNIKRIIFASTGGAIYGERNDLPVAEDAFPLPMSPYGIAKFSCEMYLRFYEQVYHFEPAILRYGNVYGPRQDPSGEAGVIAIFLTSMLKGEGVTIFGDGNQTRDYVFVEDVVKVNLILTENGKTGIYNVGTGVETSVNELFALLRDITGINVPVNYAPPRKGELIRSVLNCEKAERELNWKAKYTLKKGLEHTYYWFKKNLQI